VFQLICMHCPNCGNESDLEQKFCRKCGFNLAPISKLMQADSGDGHQPELSKHERDKLLMRYMVKWIMWGMLIMLVGIIVIVVNKQLKLDQLVGLIGSLITLGGVSVMMYGLLDTIRGGNLKKQQPTTMAATTDEVEPASTTRELEERLPIPLGSVTDRTTQLISVESREHN
jgi:hypothetical protein